VTDGVVAPMRRLWRRCEPAVRKATFQARLRGRSAVPDTGRTPTLKVIDIVGFFGLRRPRARGVDRNDPPTVLALIGELSPLARGRDRNKVAFTA
jgi:hypothetical protein